jgi:predicted adenine nucleotide alpha hydrolase (AANH) superfamily ATPase
MKVLLHICCGPCAIYPTTALRQEGFDVEGFFYNPNIHPYSEFLKRHEAVVAAGGRLELNVIYHRYDVEEFLAKIACLRDRQQQHELCWRVRLEETARFAQEHGIPNFTTTLLSSPYQDIVLIKKLGDDIAARYGLNFLARNFRSGFAQSHKISKEWQLYHQNYCGCIYSEKESLDQRRAREKHS